MLKLTLNRNYMLQDHYNLYKKPNETIEQFQEHWYSENINFPTIPQENDTENLNEQETTSTPGSPNLSYTDAPTSPKTITTTNLNLLI
ncbi:8766_t:CDS:2 [Cetraspora pellucida]|uniref:8766_t:CDS:1 n=1 Tax=Cetraspora pellucida TaxID=1433469 RepID=A0ACA9KQ82_9GLOM|nr:8766_t:CDS:2 [Cetraspora pellucida]